MSSYDSIAPFYDMIHGNRKQTVEFVLKLLRTYHPEAKTLLSAGCGTGEICKVLAKHYDITGVDLSEGMLSQARKKLPHVSFYQQNIVSLQLDQRFDVIVCLFGVLNHVLEFKDWEIFFTRAREHLNPGGIFIFDILSELCLCNLIINSPLVIETRKLLAICAITPSEEEGTVWETKGYARKKIKGEHSVLFHSILRQIAFNQDRVVCALKKVFRQVDVFDPEDETANERSELLYFVCHT